MKKTLTILILSILILSGCASPTTADKVSEDPKQTKETEQAKESKGVTAEDAAKTALKAGASMPAFELKNAKGGSIKSEDLLKDSKLVLVFYRGGWCPFCNTYLKELQESIGEIEKRGAKLVAVSPEKPDNSLSTAEKNSLKFEVLSDDKLEFARKMGLVFELDAETDRKYQENGVNLVETNGTEKPELPIAATYIVDSSGTITYAFIDPDFKKRFRTKDLLAELDKDGKK